MMIVVVLFGVLGNLESGGEVVHSERPRSERQRGRRHVDDDLVI